MGGNSGDNVVISAAPRTRNQGGPVPIHRSRARCPPRGKRGEPTTRDLLWPSGRTPCPSPSSPPTSRATALARVYVRTRSGEAPPPTDLRQINTRKHKSAPGPPAPSPEPTPAPHRPLFPPPRPNERRQPLDLRPGAARLRGPGGAPVPGAQERGGDGPPDFGGSTMARRTDAALDRQRAGAAAALRVSCAGVDQSPRVVASRVRMSLDSPETPNSPEPL
jgi:hypothetical protein